MNALCGERIQYLYELGSNPVVLYNDCLCIVFNRNELV